METLKERYEYIAKEKELLQPIEIHTAVMKQIMNCLSYNRFKVSVYMETHAKNRAISNEFENELVKPWFKDKVFAFRLSINERSIDFKNGSRITFLLPSDSTRGYKHHGCIVDSEFSIDQYNVHVKSKQIPLLTDNNEIRLNTENNRDFVMFI